MNKRLSGEVAGAEVSKGRHFFAQEEEALLWADGARAPFGTADGAEEDGMSGFGFGKGFGGEGGAVRVDGALEGMKVRYKACGEKGEGTDTAE